MKIERFLIGAALGLACIPAPAQVWDAAAAWAPPANPNGVWSYGQYNQQGVFEPLVYDSFDSEYDWNYTPDLGAQIWENSAGYSIAGVDNGQISLDAAFGTPVLRFTAPSSGNYAFDLALGGTEIPENGEEGNALAQYGKVIVDGATMPRTSFASNVAVWDFTSSLTAGQNVDIYVSDIGVPSAANTALSFSIDAVPEPASFLVFGAGILGLIARRRSKRS